ncbi:hypothetical protein CYMTET_6516 [Cymbomonas tetramitiformis]|uniref:Uncharacterized protein n=1 Tax=Cymbomonas tetramitiformis TaxID=36881 RepID=A0AAE0LIE0_9CHLO|nr:hypothetical protein CYMTET_6516 [Cymbomonas tetramitiformis]
MSPGGRKCAGVARDVFQGCGSTTPQQRPTCINPSWRTPAAKVDGAVTSHIATFGHAALHAALSLVPSASPSSSCVIGCSASQCRECQSEEAMWVALMFRKVQRCSGTPRCCACQSEEAMWVTLMFRKVQCCSGTPRCRACQSEEAMWVTLMFRKQFEHWLEVTNRALRETLLGATPSTHHQTNTAIDFPDSSMSEGGWRHAQQLTAYGAVPPPPPPSAPTFILPGFAPSPAPENPRPGHGPLPPGTEQGASLRRAPSSGVIPFSYLPIDGQVPSLKELRRSRTSVRREETPEPRASDPVEVEYAEALAAAAAVEEAASAITPMTVSEGSRSHSHPPLSNEGVPPVHVQDGNIRELYSTLQHKMHKLADVLQDLPEDGRSGLSHEAQQGLGSITAGDVPAPPSTLAAVPVLAASSAGAPARSPPPVLGREEGTSATAAAAEGIYHADWSTAVEGGRPASTSNSWPENMGDPMAMGRTRPRAPTVAVLPAAPVPGRKRSQTVVAGNDRTGGPAPSMLDLLMMPAPSSTEDSVAQAASKDFEVEMNAAPGTPGAAPPAQAAVPPTTPQDVQGLILNPLGLVDTQQAEEPPARHRDASMFWGDVHAAEPESVPLARSQWESDPGSDAASAIRSEALHSGSASAVSEAGDVQEPAKSRAVGFSAGAGDLVPSSAAPLADRRVSTGAPPEAVSESRPTEAQRVSFSAPSTEQRSSISASSTERRVSFSTPVEGLAEKGPGVDPRVSISAGDPRVSISAPSAERRASSSASPEGLSVQEPVGGRRASVSGSPGGQRSRSGTVWEEEELEAGNSSSEEEERREEGIHVKAAGSPAHQAKRRTVFVVEQQRRSAFERMSTTQLLDLANAVESEEMKSMQKHIEMLSGMLGDISATDPDTNWMREGILEEMGQLEEKVSHLRAQVAKLREEAAETQVRAAEDVRAAQLAADEKVAAVNRERLLSRANWQAKVTELEGAEPPQQALEKKMQAAQQAADEKVQAVLRVAEERVQAAQQAAEEKVQAAQQAADKEVTAAKRERQLSRINWQAKVTELEEAEPPQQAAEEKMQAAQQAADEKVQAVLQVAEERVQAAQQAAEEKVQAAQQAADKEVTAAKRERQLSRVNWQTKVTELEGAEPQQQAAEERVQAAQQAADEKVQAVLRAAEERVQAAQQAAEEKVQAAQQAADKEVTASKRERQLSRVNWQAKVIELEGAEPQQQALEERVQAAQQAAEEKVQAALRAAEERVQATQQAAKEKVQAAQQAADKEVTAAKRERQLSRINWQAKVHEVEVESDKAKRHTNEDVQAMQQAADKKVAASNRERQLSRANLELELEGAQMLAEWEAMETRNDKEDELSAEMLNAALESWQHLEQELTHVEQAEQAKRDAIMRERTASRAGWQAKLASVNAFLEAAHPHPWQGGDHGGAAPGGVAATGGAEEAATQVLGQQVRPLQPPAAGGQVTPGGGSWGEHGKQGGAAQRADMQEVLEVGLDVLEQGVVEGLVEDARAELPANVATQPAVGKGVEVVVEAPPEGFSFSVVRGSTPAQESPERLPSSAAEEAVPRSPRVHRVVETLSPEGGGARSVAGGDPSGEGELAALRRQLAEQQRLIEELKRGEDVAAAPAAGSAARSPGSDRAGGSPAGSVQGGAARESTRSESDAVHVAEQAPTAGSGVSAGGEERATPSTELHTGEEGAGAEGRANEARSPEHTKGLRGEERGRQRAEVFEVQHMEKECAAGESSGHGQVKVMEYARMQPQDIVQVVTPVAVAQGTQSPLRTQQTTPPQAGVTAAAVAQETRSPVQVQQMTPPQAGVTAAAVAQETRSPVQVQQMTPPQADVTAAAVAQETRSPVQVQQMTPPQADVTAAAVAQETRSPVQVQQMTPPQADVTAAAVAQETRSPVQAQQTTTPQLHSTVSAVTQEMQSTTQAQQTMTPQLHGTAAAVAQETRSPVQAQQTTTPQLHSTVSAVTQEMQSTTQAQQTMTPQLHGTVAALTQETQSPVHAQQAPAAQLHGTAAAVAQETRSPVQVQQTMTPQLHGTVAALTQETQSPVHAQQAAAAQLHGTIATVTREMQSTTQAQQTMTPQLHGTVAALTQETQSPVHAQQTPAAQLHGTAAAVTRETQSPFQVQQMMLAQPHGTVSAVTRETQSPVHAQHPPLPQPHVTAAAAARDMHSAAHSLATPSLHQYARGSPPSAVQSPVPLLPLVPLQLPGGMNGVGTTAVEVRAMEYLLEEETHRRKSLEERIKIVTSAGQKAVPTAMSEGVAEAAAPTDWMEAAEIKVLGRRLVEETRMRREAEEKLRWAEALQEEEEQKQRQDPRAAPGGGPEARSSGQAPVQGSDSAASSPSLARRRESAEVEALGRSLADERQRREEVEERLRRAELSAAEWRQIGALPQSPVATTAARAERGESGELEVMGLSLAKERGEQVHERLASVGAWTKVEQEAHEAAMREEPRMGEAWSLDKKTRPAGAVSGVRGPSPMQSPTLAMGQPPPMGLSTAVERMATAELQALEQRLAAERRRRESVEKEQAWMEQRLRQHEQARRSPESGHAAEELAAAAKRHDDPGQQAGASWANTPTALSHPEGGRADAGGTPEQRPAEHTVIERRLVEERQRREQVEEELRRSNEERLLEAEEQSLVQERIRMERELLVEEWRTDTLHKQAQAERLVEELQASEAQTVCREKLLQEQRDRVAEMAHRLRAVMGQKEAEQRMLPLKRRHAASHGQVGSGEGLQAESREASTEAQQLQSSGRSPMQVTRISEEAAHPIHATSQESHLVEAGTSGPMKSRLAETAVERQHPVTQHSTVAAEGQVLGMAEAAERASAMEDCHEGNHEGSAARVQDTTAPGLHDADAAPSSPPAFAQRGAELAGGAQGAAEHTGNAYCGGSTAWSRGGAGVAWASQQQRGEEGVLRQQQRGEEGVLRQQRGKRACASSSREGKRGLRQQQQRGEEGVLRQQQQRGKMGLAPSSSREGEEGGFQQQQRGEEQQQIGEEWGLRQQQQRGEDGGLRQQQLAERGSGGQAMDVRGSGGGGLGPATEAGRPEYPSSGGYTVGLAVRPATQDIGGAEMVGEVAQQLRHSAALLDGQAAQLRRQTPRSAPAAARELQTPTSTPTAAQLLGAAAAKLAVGSRPTGLEAVMKRRVVPRPSTRQQESSAVNGDTSDRPLSPDPTILPPHLAEYLHTLSLEDFAVSSDPRSPTSPGTTAHERQALYSQFLDGGHSRTHGYPTDAQVDTLPSIDDPPSTDIPFTFALVVPLEGGASGRTPQGSLTHLGLSHPHRSPDFRRAPPLHHEPNSLPSGHAQGTLRPQPHSQLQQQPGTQPQEVSPSTPHSLEEAKGNQTTSWMAPTSHAYMSGSPNGTVVAADASSLSPNQRGTAPASPNKAGAVLAISNQTGSTPATPNRTDAARATPNRTSASPATLKSAPGSRCNEQRGRAVTFPRAASVPDNGVTSHHHHGKPTAAMRHSNVLRAQISKAAEVVAQKRRLR